MKDVSFMIDGKKFICENLITETASFVVKSNPRSYQIEWDESENPIFQINQLMAENPGNLLLIDQKILSLFQSGLTFDSSRICAVKASESFKTLDGMRQVFDFLFENGFTKGEKLIVVGGGIIQDVGGFVAACYKRGISWIYFPTTLLSMCDSCIGAKTGINYKDAKNQMGLFSAPTKVIINSRFLVSLDEKDIKSGLGEILKLCSIAGKSFLDLYQEHVVQGQVKSFASYKSLILAALSIKRTIIQEDEFELSYRKSLNYGHTLGHAIEAMSSYMIPHGVAVSAGMILANELSQNRHYLSSDDKDNLNKLCYELLDHDMLTILKNISVDRVLDLLKKDKKMDGSDLSFVMMNNPGKIEFAKLKLDQALQDEIKDTMRVVF